MLSLREGEAVCVNRKKRQGDFLGGEESSIRSLELLVDPGIERCVSFSRYSRV